VRQIQLGGILHMTSQFCWSARTDDERL